MNARAAGGTVRSRRRTSATGRWTAGAKAPHLDVGALQRGQRARKDGRGKAARRERSQEERVAALQGEVQRLAGARSGANAATTLSRSIAADILNP